MAISGVWAIASQAFSVNWLGLVGCIGFLRNERYGDIN
ncbi:hypothetical protein RintRC_4697 [Richelia intracellularis]|nr:hypothetical protein RintRC_4697 [Richelia intracellularis]